MTATGLDPAIDRIAALGVMPAVEIDTVDRAERLADALARGGVDVIEVTLRTAAALRAIETLRSSHPEALIGAGTVRSPEDARRASEAGAQFMVSPGGDAELVAVCGALGAPFVPGACTPTEIGALARAGVRVLKLFPAEAIGGVAYLRAIAPPFRELSFIPTGGIDAANLADYLRLPQVIACAGSWMTPRDVLEDRCYGRVARLAREARLLAAQVRSGRAEA